jgi:two-component system sensor histidine kinase SenX3
MRESIGQVVASRRQQAVEADLSLRVQVEESLPEVMGDPEWLHRAADALVDNAIKFSPNAGEISISAGFRAEQMQLAISDQGLGIPADQIDRVFDRFRRIHEEGPYVFDGVGLGLPLVKQVVEQHGGAIEVQSVEGKGSTFTLSLPVAG